VRRCEVRGATVRVRGCEVLRCDGARCEGPTVRVRRCEGWFEVHCLPYRRISCTPHLPSHPRTSHPALPVAPSHAAPSHG